ncbi:hypothetical protein KEF85_06025 [Methylomonas paludis]|uniref:Uncharacterized protein n=1 Tax=Methylomonas paludis TaxID=1173101 RepID=A0A975MQA8_9GAMM|nr:hypothetical protein [Methylomonas paludis]QWF72012.1 hypothetical protein KEF85_06025 [Methylomonas paludis]
METTKQNAETKPLNWGWVETRVWTERMLAALANGVQGGKWFSLYDKINRPEVLEAAYQRVSKNKGAAGVDKIGIERFESNKHGYLNELHTALKTGS